MEPGWMSCHAGVFVWRRILTREVEMLKSGAGLFIYLFFYFFSSGVERVQKLDTQPCRKK